jgi:translation initiation factor IF-2
MKLQATSYKLVPTLRPPVVVIVGHIDHGKSTLLDYIRQTKVTETEVGGITQRVSAYEVKHQEKTITFLDTPGHEAFSQLRERGAKIADLAIVVISAEEGVKAQTLEALTAVTTAGFPYLIAINKIDRPNANVERTKQGLVENNILVEGYGGTIPCLPISAKTGAGVPELLELILLMAELAELTTEPDTPATGFVLEATRCPKVGVIATLIIKSGQLQTGDFLIVGNIIGRIKRLQNFRGETVTKLEASSPAVVLGLPEMPAPGVPFMSASDKITAEMLKANLEVGLATASPTSNSTTPGIMLFPIILKADNLGSLEALEKEVTKLSTEAVTISIVHRGIGQITENDVKLGAGTPPAVIVGFNLQADRGAIESAEKYAVVIKTFDIIYHLSEWLAEEVLRRAPVVEVEETLGEIRVLKIFSHEKNRQIIGASVTSGCATDRQRVRIIRRGTPLGEGEIIELKQQKISVKRVEEGNQFGALVESKIAIAPGDTLLIFTLGRR